MQVIKYLKQKIRHYQYLSFLPEKEMVFHHKSSNKPQIPFAPAFSGPIGYFPFSGGSSLFLFPPSLNEKFNFFRIYCS